MVAGKAVTTFVGPASNRPDAKQRENEVLLRFLQRNPDFILICSFQSQIEVSTPVVGVKPRNGV
jgi:hypothetical protein